MQKASGVDMTNYDGAIINLYEKNTFIPSHNDVDESKSNIMYPVIGINLGGKGNFSIERIPGARELSLEAGSGYIFGVNGTNREVWHRTFPTPQNTFLPELTTKIDGKTYPAGSYRVTITMRRVEPLLPGIPTVPAISNTSVTTAPSTNLATYTNHSGGAIGSDTEWDVVGKKFGMINNNHYYIGERGPKNAPLGNIDITNDPIAVEGASKVAQAAREMWGYKYNIMKDQRLIRNWAQVANSDAVFAIGKLGKEGDIWKGDEKSAEPKRRLKVVAVQGGTGYAVEMAIQAGKSVYVFDQTRDQWYKNVGGEWSQSEVPVLTENFAGIGTREINDLGKQAIRDVYEKTFNSAESEQEIPTILIQDRILELQYQLTQLEEIKDDMYASSIPVLTAVNMPKITPESARRETGVKIGTDKDINIGLIDSKGKSVEVAAEYLMETEFYEELGFPNVDMQDIRNYIIDILQVGKKNFIDQYTNESQIESIKGEIAELKNQANQELEEAEQQYLSTMQSVHFPLFRTAYQEQGSYPDQFAAPNNMLWVKNKFNNYELLDQDGIVYLSNMNMITGKMVPVKKSKLPVNEKIKKDTINQLNVMIKEFRLDEILASKQEDVYKFIAKLDAAKTDSEFQDIIAKIQKLIC